MTPDEAWSHALWQLNKEMPRASFDNYVRDTRVMKYQDGVLTVGCGDFRACAWLTARLTSTVQRMLVGIMNIKKIEVRFVAEHQDVKAKLPE
jgi:hypothetical protein